MHKLKSNFTGSMFQDAQNDQETFEIKACKGMTLSNFK